MLLGSARGLLRFVVIKILLLPRTRVGKIGFNRGWTLPDESDKEMKGSAISLRREVKHVCDHVVKINRLGAGQRAAKWGDDGLRVVYWDLRIWK